MTPPLRQIRHFGDHDSFERVLVLPSLDAFFFSASATPPVERCCQAASAS